MADVDVLILMGSDSDAPIMAAAGAALDEFGLTWEMTVASAHRSPARVMRLVDEAPGRGVKVFIVGAGAAAHLAGVVAAHALGDCKAPSVIAAGRAEGCPTASS